MNEVKKMITLYPRKGESFENFSSDVIKKADKIIDNGEAVTGICHYKCNTPEMYATIEYISKENKNA